ncbi:hypothetical protein D3C73_490040 [compost metagenome]
MLQLFENQNASAAGDDEAVAIGVIGARGIGCVIVILRRHGAHRVEQVRHGPVEIFVAAGEHDVLLAPLDHFSGIADAMRRSRAGRRD